MNKIHLGEVESKFADIIWENEPLATSELTKLCEEKLNWKRTTTYTVLKRLGKRGLFCNNGGIVTSLISRDEFNSLKSEMFIDESFNGSLPAFLAAFSSSRKLTDEDVSEIKKLIDTYKG